MDILKIVNEKINTRLASGNDNAFYLLDIEDVRRKYFAWVKHIPRVTPFYAIKSNDHEAVLKIFKDEGAGFDCASRKEMEDVLKLGVSPYRIIYSHTVKQLSHLKFAASHNIQKVTFDSEQELYKIKEHHPTAEVVLRIKFDSQKTVVQLGLKFGCDRNLEAPKLIELCKKLDMNLIGVSFHVGSGTEDCDVFGKAIEAVHDIFKVAKDFGFSLNFVDIGGGFVGDNQDNIEKYSKPINEAIEKFFKDPSITIISEPGRYFVESAFTRAIQIILKKTTPDGVMNYYVNDGIYMSFLINHIYNHEYLKFGEFQIVRKTPTQAEPKKLISRVWGITCNSMDKLFDNLLLPEVEMGDWFVFKNMGAYTTNVSTNFNGFKIGDDDIIVV
jgi:ornithine decarboxylase